jgi:uncharacterized protein (UPF0333 family)
MHPSDSTELPPVAETEVPSHRRGATSMEYLLVLSLILVVAIMGIDYFGQSTKNTTKKANDAIQNATKTKDK